MFIPEAKRKVAWRKQEQRAHDDGAKKVAASGAGVLKGDNKGENFLIQCKTTYKSSRTIGIKEWRKVVSDARKEDRMPVMQMQLEDRERLAVLPWEDFIALLEQAGIEI